MQKQLLLMLAVTVSGLGFNARLQAQSCPGIASVSFNVLAPPVPTISGTTQICAGGGSTTLTVPGTFDSYNWGGAGSGSGQSITATAAGTYVVTVTNAAGCTGTTSVAVTQLPAPAPNIAQATYQCNGQRVLNAGAGFASYAWSAPGGSNQTLTVTSPGIYTVTVTNAAGCTGTDDINVTIPAPPFVAVTGPTTFCQGAATTLGATAGLSSYSWTGGGSGNTLLVTSPGTYTVTATDAFGCTVTSSATVTELPAPAPTITGVASFCAGGSTTLDAGGGFNSYSWSGGNGSNQTATVSTGGTYTVTVTAANGCTSTDSQVVNVTAAPTPSIVTTPYACNGQVTMNAGSGFSSYAWSAPGGSNQNLTVSNPGTYVVTVTNALGCSGTDNFVVSIPAPPAVNIGGATSFCQGASTVLSATPGLNAYTWTGGGSGPNLTVTAAGTYTVTATDGFGCTTTSSATVSTLPSPTPTVTGTNVICSGSTTTFSVPGSFSSYQWSGGNGTGSSITVGNAGTYTVTVTAANGCTGTASRTLALNASPSPAISEQAYQCNGQVTLSVGNFSTYNWSTSQSSPTISVNQTNTYTVTVSSAAGCTGTATYFLVVPDQPVVNITGNNQICPGATTLLSATPGFGAYQWSSTPATSANITVGSAGVYTVTVTDGFGCTTTNQFTVNALAAPAPNISGPSAICPGSTATFSVPGTFTSYQWSTLTNGPSISTTTAGTYTVTVTAANGCTGTDSQTLVLSNTLQPQVVAQPYLCNGQFTLDAGTGFATYNWSTTGTGQTITVNASGTYLVTVTESGGCTGTASFNVNIPPPPVASVSGGATVCPGSTVLLSAPAGFAGYTWSNGFLTSSVSVSTPDDYTVTVTDAAGCTATATATVGNFTPPVASISGPSTICTNSSATFSAPTGFSTYLWSTGLATASITVDTAATYAVTVTDANGCTASASQDLLVLNALQPQIATQPYACDGQISLDAGTGFSNYLWSNGDTTAVATALQTNNYTVTVTGTGGCTGTASVAVTVPVLPVAAVTGGGNVCPGAASTLTATTGFAAYQWSTTDNTTSISVTNPTTYTVTVTDTDGCTATATGTVGNFAQPVVSIAGNVEICAGSTTTLTASSGFASYQWSNGPATASITVDSVSNYVVTVTDSNGCTTSSALTTQAVTALNPAIALQPYQCTGSLTLDAGAGFSTYLWSGGGTATQTLTVSTSGTYTVTVSNATGCTGTTQLAVTVPILPVAAVTGGGNVCPGAASTLTATAGFAAYQWSTTDNTASISTSTPATYTVTVTDTDGCTTTATGTVGNFAQPTVSIAGNAQICAGSTTTLTASSGFANYQWSNGPVTASITVDSVSNYVVTVTDANGCTTSSTLTTQAVTALNPAITLQPYQCTGSLTLDAGAGFSTYSWSGGGAATQTLTVSTSGTYTVTVSNATGCTGTTQLAVTVPVLPVAAVTGGGNVCPGAASTLTATAGFAAYQWSTTDNTASISTSTPATYTVTVTDTDGCTTTATGTVGNFAQPTVSIAGTAQICAGSTTTLTASSGFANYQWSNGPATASITVDSVSNYVVTVTDANGCTTSSALATQAVTALNPAIALQPYQCTGSLTLDAGAGFSTYSWSGGGAATQTLTVSNSGTYTVTVSNATGCTGTTQLAVTVPVLPVAAVTGGGNVCPGAASTLTATAGFAAYQWSTTDNTTSISTSTPATYTVTVTDTDGCTTTATGTVGNFAQPTVSIAGTAQICAGNSTTLSATSGFASYQWSTMQSTSSIVVTTAGNYSTTVTDANGCTATATRAVVVGPLPVLTAAVTSDFGGFATPCGGSALGAASATVTGGTAPFGYVWSGGAGSSAQVSNLLAGTYLLTVTDALGCTGTASVTLNSAPPLAPTLEVVAPTCDEPGQVTVLFAQTPANATTIALDNGTPELLASNSFIFNDLESGVYTVQLADNFGCTTELTAAVPPGPQLLEQVGDTLEVARGTVLTLPVVLSFNPTSIAWTPATDLSCSDCLTPEVTVDGPLLLQLTASGLGDCVAEGTYLLKVKAQSGVYAPNAIAPGSGANGGFTLFGDEFLVQIRRLQVYDRWGNQVAALANFQPNDPALGWDGRFREQVVNPGVYVWWAELEYADGTTKIVDGDVTIVR